MAGMNNFPGPTSALQMCVVASGGDPKKGDHPNDHSCSLKLFSPLEHSDDGVSLDDLPFSSRSINPTQNSQQAFPGAPDPGTILYVLKSAGESMGIILGQPNSLLQPSSGNLMNGTVQELQQRSTGMSIPPQVEETKERGVKIRKIKEKDKEHSLSLLEGLPVHGALFNMSGFRMPQIKKVPTAKQYSQQMLSQDMLNQLPGQIMTLGQMFQGLMGNAGGGGGGGGVANSPSAGGGTTIPQSTTTPMQNILGSLSPEMSAAVNSLSLLVQGLSTGNGVAFFSGNVVHEPTYLQNAETLLSQVNNIDDLMYVLSRLQWDTTLFGRENLDNVVLQLETAFGVALQEVDHNGTITVTYDTAGQNAINAYVTSYMANTTNPGISSANANTTTIGTYVPSGGGTGAGAGGGGGGGGGGAGGIAQQVQSMIGGLFGQSSGIMMDMYKRLSPITEQETKSMYEKLNQQQPSQKLSSIVQKTVEGGDPTNKQNYDNDETGGNFSISFE